MGCNRDGRPTCLATLAICCVIAAAAATSTRADLININFTGTAYTGTSETSPATPGGPAGTWNNFTSAADWETDSKTLVLADGSLGPTLTFDSTSNAVAGWTATSLSLSNTDYTTVSGVYNVPNLYESGLINGGNNTTGLRIKGLAPGTYDVFLVPLFRGAQAAGVKADPAVTFVVGLGNDTDARNSGSNALTSTAANPTQNIDTRFTTWVPATTGSTAYNYIGAQVTIDSTSRWLTFLLSDSATSGPDRPGPGVIQIRSVGVPEVSAFLFGGAAVATVIGSRLLKRRQGRRGVTDSDP